MMRRGIIGGLIAVSLIMFTMYFREGTSGPLHGVQQVGGTAAMPAQSIGSRVTQPFQDAWGWVAGLFDARGQNEELKAQNAALQQRVLALSDQSAEIARLRAQLKADDSVPGGYTPVNASVIGRSPTSWYSRASLDAGSNDGIVVNSPVVAGGGPGAALVGVVTEASPLTSTVTFLTDPSVRIGATVDGSGGALGVLRPTVGGQLMMDGVPRDFGVQAGSIVRTAGFSAGLNLPSVFPRGIAIGQVAGSGSRAVDTFQTIQVSPYVDVRTLSEVTVLTPTSAAAKRRAEG